jgi:hypothetical protein
MAIITLGANAITALPAGVGGKVLQVVQGTTTSTGSTTSSSDVTTNLSATITPSSSSNKILVIVSQTHFAVGSNPTCLAKLWRGTIGSGTELGRKCFGSYGLSIELASPADFCVLDTPSTTSATTYNTSVAFKAGSRVDYNVDRDSGTQKVTINLIEIAG